MRNLTFAAKFVETVNYGQTHKWNSRRQNDTFYSGNHNRNYNRSNAPPPNFTDGFRRSRARYDRNFCSAQVLKNLTA